MFAKVLSIRIVLVGLVLFLLAPVAGVIVYDLNGEAHDIRAEAEQAALELARVTASDTARRIVEIREVLTKLADRPAVRNLDHNHCDTAFSDFRDFYPGYTNLLTKTLDGRFVCSALPVPVPDTRQPDLTISIEQIKRTHAFVIGRANRGFLTGRWHVVLDQPLFDATGALTGTVGATMDLRRFSPLVGESAFRTLPEHTVATLVDEHGVILARSEQADKWIGTRLPPASPLFQSLRQRQGMLATAGIDGLERLFAFVPVEGTPWQALVGIPTAPVTAKIQSLYWRWLTATACGMALSLGIALWLGRAIVRPIRAVARTAELVGGGHLDQRTPDAAKSGISEVAQVARQFDAMLDSLDRERQLVGESDERFRTLFAEMVSGFAVHEIILDDEGRAKDYRFLAVNPAFEAITGLKAADILGRRALEILPDLEMSWIERYGHVALTGEPTTFEGYTGDLNKYFDVRAFRPQPGMFAVTIHDITERKRAEENLRTLALFDPLTHLPNRKLLRDRLEHTLAANARRGGHGAILVIDLDNFKALNDTLGHAVGDQLLITVAERLLSCARARDCVARLGGDEFVVILEDLGNAVDIAAVLAEEVGERILAAVSQPCRLEDRDHHGTTSIGICLFPGPADSADDLLKRAEAAMYRAKKDGRNTLRFFDPGMQAALEARVALETELRRALIRKQFILHYQPQFDRHRRIVGAEALVRWQHPERGLVPPGDFIPVAEETALIVPIGQCVLETACVQLRTWQDRSDTRRLDLAVNVSARQFRQPDFVERVVAILAKTGAPPTQLKLELTESLVLDDVDDTIKKMHALKALGIGFSMDDFGTGYSSLSYLKLLPLTQMKIDRSFIRDLVVDPSDAVIVRTILGMAESLGLAVVAEGVETEAQFEFLEQHGCQGFQGFVFSPPLPLDRFEDLSRRNFDRT